MVPTGRSTSRRTTSRPSPALCRSNPSKIEAIRILLDRPQDWSTEALSELRKKAPGRSPAFHGRNLQKAHEVHYHKALVDIISMVKHAARQDEPLLTAEERVERAFAGDRRPDVYRGAAAVAGPHPDPSDAEPLHRPGDFEHVARLCPSRGGWGGPTGLRRQLYRY